MVNAPPTPPPTSAVEISDAARTVTAEAQLPSASATPSAAPVSDPTPVTSSSSRTDIYQAAFPIVTELVANGNYAALITHCERTDLNGDGDNSPTRFFTSAPLILAYLIVNNLPPARYALERLPESLVSHPLAKQLRDLLSATSSRKHTAVYSEAKLLYDQVQGDLIDVKLASVISALTRAFIDSFRQRTFQLVAKAYSSIHLSLVETYMGWSTEEVLTAARDAGWLFDEGSKTLTPQSKSMNGNASITGASSLHTFSFVASNVAQLEA
ncbi:hypothetical protein ONZ45_g10149 [Pleurotus djamor]|nr:hypothetical protein ONZ45_g10149 [Pleurotus djamor]